MASADNGLREALEMTGCRDAEDLIDMANVGQSLMNEIHVHSHSGFLKGWAPAEDPAEIVADLLNEIDERPDGVFIEIAAERERQISGEGWTPEHDDRHDAGQMARAGAAYAYAGSFGAPSARYAMASAKGGSPITRALWPWSLASWKPKDPRRDLVRAAALIVAEIQRLDRAARAGSAQDA